MADGVARGANARGGVGSAEEKRSGIGGSGMGEGAVELGEAEFDFGGGEGGGGFIEDEDTALASEGGSDFDELALADAQGAEGLVGGNVLEADGGDGARGSVIEGAVVDEAEAARQRV